MKKKNQFSLLTYTQASDILLPERESKLYVGEVDGKYYWIKENPNSYIALGLSGGTPFPVRTEITRIVVGSVIEYEKASYLVFQDETSHVAFKKQRVLKKVA